MSRSFTLKDTDKGYNALRATVKELSKGVRITVGVRNKSKPHEGSKGLTIAELAAIHEFGLGDAPQRSFIRGWIDEAQKNWFGRLKNGVGRALTKKDRRWMQGFGQYCVAGIRARMLRGIAPALKPATLARKKNGSTPLIETGQLFDAIGYKIESSK